jgi:hypothetical protein
MQVEIIPKSKRARETIEHHGKIMNLCDDREDKFLVQSLDETWNGMKWFGWFRNFEASYEKVDHGTKG